MILRQFRFAGGLESECLMLMRENFYSKLGVAPTSSSHLLAPGGELCKLKPIRLIFYDKSSWSEKAFLPVDRFANEKVVHCRKDEVIRSTVGIFSTCT